MRVALDLTGCDQPAAELFKAVMEARVDHPDVSWQVFWPEDQSEPAVDMPFIKAGLPCLERPLAGVKVAPTSAIVLAIEALANGDADVLLTCGPGAALVAAAVLHLPLRVGVTRPALAAWCPTLIPGRRILLLDCGATLDPTVEQMLQFARMGIEIWQERHGLAIPRIGLLSVGQESHKGTPIIKQTYQQLQQQELGAAFIGCLEPAHVLQGASDIVLTGGLVGNVFLKTLEALWPTKPVPTGVARLLGYQEHIFKAHGGYGSQQLKGAIDSMIKIMRESESRQLS